MQLHMNAKKVLYIFQSTAQRVQGKALTKKKTAGNFLR